MTDVFEEVEEDIRSERLKRLARNWLPIVGGILLVALVAALAWWGWQSFQTSRAHAGSIAYQRGLEALQTGNSAGAETAFAEAEKDGNGAYKALALQQRAGLAVAANRIPDAIKLFDEAAKASGDPILHDTAVYKSVLLMMDNGATLEELEARLEPLTKEGRPMLPFAQEALGMARLQFNKPAEAREVFVLLTLGQDVPDSVRQRAQAAIGMIDTGVAAGLPAIVTAQSVTPPAAPAPTPEQLAQAAQAAQQ
ncbi:tetratricopeptide repeat protein [Brevundimonas sp.]|uniref:tetratricopeptide repeat protein n=1 Tax=Brevundimonas sp. TaxID=1871086 RepID=UPI00261FEAAD|nr:tetratricopeptide repeat protein [Brevundimonas sp.]